MPSIACSRLAEVFGADVGEPRFVVPLGAEDRAWARALLRDVPRPRLMLNLGASWKTKRWPPEHFAAIARRAYETRGAGLVAIGSAEDSPLVAELRGCLDPIPVLDLCGRTTLRQVAALAAESDLVLSNDSGPLHLARPPAAGWSGSIPAPALNCTGPTVVTRPRSRATSGAREAT